MMLPKLYERFCQQYRPHAKGAPKCHWGSRMLKRLVVISGSSRSKKKRISPRQQQLPFAFDLRLNRIPEERQQEAVRFRRANGI
jgi:putative transposase